MANKYITLRRLQTFLDNLKNVFALLGHKHTLSDLTDYKIDSALSSSSNNPVANSILDAEFNAVSQAMETLETSINGKSNVGHTHSEFYLKADHDYVQIYDSGEITAQVNAFANIDISGYKKLRVVVKCVNDGTNTTSKNGSVTFTSTNGTTYQFPCWTTMFTNAAYTSGNMATFEINDGWLICSDATRILKTSNFLGTEGGTADNLPSTGSGIMRCTNSLSKMMVSSLDQDANYYFLEGSRVIVWGCSV